MKIGKTRIAAIIDGERPKLYWKKSSSSDLSCGHVEHKLLSEQSVKLPIFSGITLLLLPQRFPSNRVARIYPEGSKIARPRHVFLYIIFNKRRFLSKQI